MEIFPTPSKSLLLLFLLYFCSYPLVRAQNTFEFQRRRFRRYNNTNYPLYLGIALAISIALIIIAYIIIKFYFKPQPQIRPRTHLLTNNHANKGLDPSILESFPIFKYSKVTGLSNGTGHIECSVCLSPFEAGEMLRSLPKCNHVFHVSCLDPWLKDHSTCPLCRMNLVLEPSELAKAKMVRVDQGEREDEEGRGEVEVSREGDIEEGQVARHKRWNSMGGIAGAERVEMLESSYSEGCVKGNSIGEGEIIGKFKRSSSTL